MLAVRRAAPGALLAVLSALALIACGSSSEEEGGDQSAGGNAGGNGSCAKEPVTVGFIPKLDTDPYFATTRKGAEEAAQELGGKVIQSAPSKATGEAQIEFINNLAAKRVGVIAIAGSDANAVAPALKRAQQQGVKVMTFDSDVSPDARTLFVNQAASASIGEQMLDSMEKLLGGSGKFAVLSSTPTATNQNAWIDSMRERLKSDAKFADMELVKVVYGEESEQINRQQTLALTQAYPDLAGIIVPAGIGLPAAARALEQSGDLGRIKLTGLAPATIMRKYIESGDAQDIWWNVSDLGYLSYAAAQALAQCKLDGSQGQKFHAGRLGSFTVGAKGEIILGPAEIVTPKNLSEFKF